MNNVVRTKSVFKPQFLLFALLLLGLFLASCGPGAGAAARGWSGAVIDDDTLFLGSKDGRLVAVGITDGRLLWSSPLETANRTGGFFGCSPVPSTVAIYGTPSVDGDLVYIGGYSGKIYTFSRDKFRNEPRWVYPRQDSIGGVIIGGTVLNQGRLYFAADNGKVYALDATDGFKVWEFQTRDKVWATPAVGGDTLFIGSFDRRLYALDTVDGSKQWEFETGGAIVSEPVVSGNTVYFGSLDRYFYALDADYGTVKWKFIAGNVFWARPVVRNGIVYAANLDGRVYVRNAETGERQMEFDLGGAISPSPVLVDGLLVVATEKGVLYTLNTDTRQKDLLADMGEKVYGPLAASDGKVYIHTDKDNLYEIDVRSGAKRQIGIK